jgi:hypothetical protein
MTTIEQVYVFYQQECDHAEKHFSRGHTKKYPPLFTEKEWEEIRRLNKIQEEEKRLFNDQNK